MHFSLIVTIAKAVAISFVFIQDVSAAPTKRLTSLNHNTKRASASSSGGAVFAGGVDPWAYFPYGYPQPPGPAAGPAPACPNPKDPKCPPVGTVPAGGSPPPATGFPLPGLTGGAIAPAPITDLNILTQGAAQPINYPDVASLFAGIVTSQLTGATSLVPGAVGATQGALVLPPPGTGGED